MFRVVYPKASKRKPGSPPFVYTLSCSTKMTGKEKTKKKKKKKKKKEVNPPKRNTKVRNKSSSATHSYHD